MSLDAAKAFIEKMSTDEEFRNRMHALDNRDERLRLIHAEGYDCTEEEIGRVGTELTESDLDVLAGGGSNVATINISFN